MRKALKLVLLAPYSLITFILWLLIGILVALEVYFRYLSYKDELTEEQKNNHWPYLHHEYNTKVNAIEEKAPKPKLSEQLLLSITLSIVFLVIFL